MNLYRNIEGYCLNCAVGPFGTSTYFWTDIQGMRFTDEILSGEWYNQSGAYGRLIEYLAKKDASDYQILGPDNDGGDA